MKTNNLNRNSVTLRLPKVLLIEDHLQTAELVKMLMSIGRYACHVEKQTTDIIALLDEHQPDLVILDYILPFINGGELCSAIKSDHQYRSTPVIIYSAYPKVLLSLGTYHCDSFIAKPFDVKEVLSTIENILCPKIVTGMRRHFQHVN